MTTATPVFSNPSANPIATPTALELVDGPNFIEVLKELEPEYSALAEEDLLPVNLDVAEAGATAIWAAARMSPLRAELVARFPEAGELLDKLPKRAQAALQAHFEHSAATTPASAVPVLVEKLERYRALFLQDIAPLVRRGALAQSDVPELGAPQNHKHLAVGTATLVSLLRNNWERIKDRTGLTLEELEDAQDAAQRLSVAVIVRERGPSAVGKTAIVRQQTMTMLFRTYEELRRSFAHLRWYERDLEDFAPSLYATRANRAKRNADTLPDRSEAPVPATQPQETSSRSVSSSASAGQRIPDGMPGSSPTD